ncbi:MULTISPECIES: hypothetical protein [unclassified Polaribacter]|uniref:hypothetical protein n=1 Tax=unclassified Polaribacter TaxID=196858 RepID=UPI0011BE82DA|nr:MULTISPECIES: hypothetical protein [unclassified Polaribacter]TXD50706.1 hypothetical protein ES043_15050 [Polaribacter sp. IC063]TXD58271.1 hypothetical protein ES044_12640 [Polaribacter sp. IC066]
MKKILIISAITIIGFTSCKNEKKEGTENKVIEVIEKVDNTEKVSKLFTEFNSLYDELLSFKGKSDFKKFGFSKGGKYNKWLSNVKELKNNPEAKLLLQKGVLVGYLEQLGLSYVASKGKETEVTKSFNKIFSEAISSNPIAKIETEFKIIFDSTKVSTYKIEDLEIDSFKPLIKNLSEYETQELKDLPEYIRHTLSIVVPFDITKESLENTMKSIVYKKSRNDNDVDEIIIFAYDYKKDIGMGYTFGKLLWAPKGKIGNATPEIAINNNRNSYKFDITIKNKVGNIKKSDLPTKIELEIYSEIVNENGQYTGKDDDEIRKIVMKKYKIKTVKEYERIYLKVGVYKIF